MGERPTAVGLDADVVVIGLGGVGSAAACFAARRGLRVLGLERFGLGGHLHGASHDHSRIIRRSYHTEHYVRLTAAAYDAWRDVERASGEQCIWTTGGIDLFPARAAIDITTYADSMDAAGVPYTLLDGAEVRRRWPAITVADDVVALHQVDTGLVSPDRAVPLLQRLAIAAGAELRGGMVVRTLTAGDGFVEVAADGAGRPLRARTAVVAADAWANEVLAGLDVRLPLTVLQEQVTYYAVGDPAPFAIGRLPVWIWMDEPSFYGFPLFGRPGVKIAQDCGGTEVTADDRGYEPDPNILERTDAFGRSFFGGRLGPAVHTATCLYALTPDRDFVLDRVRGHPNVLVALGAAHGFKFAAGSGARSPRWPLLRRSPTTSDRSPSAGPRSPSPPARPAGDQLVGVTRPLPATPVSLRP